MAKTDPIFEAEIPLGGLPATVRVDDTDLPVVGMTCAGLPLVEAHVDLGTRKGWKRRPDLEPLRAYGRPGDVYAGPEEWERRKAAQDRAGR